MTHYFLSNSDIYAVLTFVLALVTKKFTLSHDWSDFLSSDLFPLIISYIYLFAGIEPLFTNSNNLYLK